MILIEFILKIFYQLLFYYYVRYYCMNNLKVLSVLSLLLLLGSLLGQDLSSFGNCFLVAQGSTLLHSATTTLAVHVQQLLLQFFKDTCCHNQLLLAQHVEGIELGDI